MKKIALIAHDRLKPEMARFIKEREDWLWGRALVATGRTADFMENAEFKIPIAHLEQGRSGGYKQMVQMVSEGAVEMVFFFRDPALNEADHPDIADLLKICLEGNIPIALNPSTAELLILGRIKLETTRKKNEA